LQRGKFPVLLTASLVSSLIMLDSNIVAVSLPAIGRSLSASFTDIQWVISAYVLTYAALLLAIGSYADLQGRRKAMLIGLAVFAGASAACGIAATSLTLNLARGVQGVGGALLLTASLAIISAEFTGEARAGAFAFWGASLGIALAVGPIIGGAITNVFGWRWIFLVNVPVCALLVVATLRVVAESRDPTAKQLDYIGIVTFSLGLGLLVWALIDGNDDGWTSTGILLRLTAAGMFLVAFVLVELRRARPMVDFALFRRRTFVGAVLAMIGYGASAAGMASGLASTTRFIGILISVAGMGAVLSRVVRRVFGAAAMRAGLDQATSIAAAKRVTSGDLSGMLSAAPAAMRSALHTAGLASFADGFAAASLLAAVVALAAAVLTFSLVGAEDTAPPRAEKTRPYKFVDCRDPL
jgi:MFS family permease